MAGKHNLEADIETEIKFEIKSEKEITAKLKKLGAKRINKVFEKNIRFDNERGEFSKNRLLRLRKDKKSRLTYKENLVFGRFRTDREYEVELSNFEIAKKILEFLGFRKIWTYEKVRTLYTLGDVKIFLDRLPIGLFLEMEGKEKNIRKIIRMLGFEMERGTGKTYHMIYQEYCKNKGVKLGDLVFK